MNATSALGQRFGRVLGAPDRVRRSLLVALGPFTRLVLTQRERRVAFAGTFGVFLSLLLAASLPMWLLALGPFIWGVLHVLVDIRYLVIREGLHRRWPMVATSAVGFLGAGLGYGLSAVVPAAFVCVLLAVGSLARKGVALALVATLGWAAFRYGYGADVVFAHAHNLVAVVFFLLWRRRGSRLHLLPVGAFTLAAVMLVSGTFDSLLARPEAFSPFSNLFVEELSATLAPGLEGTTALRVVALYAFAQSVHYALWVRLIPDEARPSETPRSFRQSVRVLFAEVTPILGYGALLLFGVFWVFAAVDLALARTWYFRLSFFHGYLELIVLFVFFVEQRFPLAGGARPVR